jgi:hypothetical protein
MTRHPTVRGVLAADNVEAIKRLNCSVGSVDRGLGPGDVGLFGRPQQVGLIGDPHGRLKLEQGIRCSIHDGHGLGGIANHLRW